MQHKKKFPQNRLSFCEVAIFQDPRDSEQPRISLVQIFEKKIFHEVLEISACILGRLAVKFYSLLLLLSS